MQAISVSLRVDAGENVRGYSRHPTRLMWANNLRSLAAYGLAICDEWIKRGYRDTQRPKFETYYSILADSGDPCWLGDERFHSSHRASLLFKNPEWYGQFGWKEKPEINYFWPSVEFMLV